MHVPGHSASTVHVSDIYLHCSPGPQAIQNHPIIAIWLVYTHEAQEHVIPQWGVITNTYGLLNTTQFCQLFNILTYIQRAVNSTYQDS